MADDTTSLDWKNLPLVLVYPTSFSDLPGDVATNILARLPVKTLIRSTTVSKKWYSLIKNPSFIEAHLAHSLSKLSAINKTGTNNDGTNGNGCILLAPNKLFSEEPMCSIFYDDKSCTPHSTLKIPFQTFSKTLKIVGSCNGLVCLTDDGYAFGRYVYLYNPCVQKYRKLSNEFSFFVDWTNVGSAYPVLGFGYHEAEKDYRVVRTFYSFHDVFPKIRSRTEVYSMREKKWRSVEAQMNTSAYQGCSAFLDGCIYWLAVDKPRPPRITTVVWFDLNDEVFHKVGMPQDYDKYCKDVDLPLHVNIMRWNDAVSICVVEPRKGNSVRCVLWVLKKDDGGELSWKKQRKLVLGGDFFGMPVGFTWTGKVVVDAISRPGGKGIVGFPKTAVLNLKDMKFQDLALDGPHTVDTHFLESLVLFLE